MSDKQFAPWRQGVRAAIIAAIERNRAAGLVSMGHRNLFHVTRLPQSGGPTGTNCQWAAFQIFREELNLIPAAYRKDWYEQD